MANLKLSFAILFGFVAMVHAQFCYKRYAVGKWISQGNCDNQENDRQILKNSIGKRANGGVRLVGGKSYGRVEIHYEGVWGTICDNHWDINDARVVCRMLGFQKTVRAPHFATFGRGTGPVLLDDVSCSGSEASITECGHRGWGVNDCDHSEDASVICQRTCSNDENIGLRLVGGNSSYGRVEIYIHRIWGTICDNNWDIIDARVACRMLGFPNAGAALSRAFFGQGIGPILAGVACVGNESSIHECRRGNLVERRKCRHYRDASVICHQLYISVRLANGNSSYGRVEINVHGVWGTICDKNWDIREARVICRMLGFPNAAAVPGRRYFGPGTGRILLEDVACLGNETSIAECNLVWWNGNDCSHYHDASVICQQLNTSETNISVRLAGGNSSYGRVEINYNGVWGTICDDSWGIKEARVICRMLGYPDAVAAPRYARFGPDTGLILLNEVACSGREISIAQCHHGGWFTYDSSNAEYAGVVCRQ